MTQWRTKFETKQRVASVFGAEEGASDHGGTVDRAYWLGGEARYDVMWDNGKLEISCSEDSLCQKPEEGEAGGNPGEA